MCTTPSPCPPILDSSKSQMHSVILLEVCPPEPESPRDLFINTIIPGSIPNQLNHTIWSRATGYSKEWSKNSVYLKEI